MGWGLKGSGAGGFVCRVCATQHTNTPRPESVKHPGLPNSVFKPRGMDHVPHDGRYIV
jgi:hypothetical protein